MFKAAKLALCVLSFAPVFLPCVARSQVFAWGDNSRGLTNLPAFATNVVSLAAGDDHAIALLADRHIVAWGDNYYGQTNVPSYAVPAMAIGGAEVNGFSVLEDGNLRIWGTQFYSGGKTNVPAEATNIIAVPVGPAGDHGLALKANGSVIDWGSRKYEATLTNIPASAKGIVAVASGSHYAVALRSDGRVIFWGGTSGQASVPTAATNIIAVAAGYGHFAALRSDGRVVTWGGLDFFHSGSINPPFNATNITDLGCGGYHIMALRRDGRAVLWGNNNDGQLNAPARATNLTFVGGSGIASFAIAGSGAPAFYGPSIPRTVASGQTAFLRLVASGQFPIAYQWTFMGTNIPNATNSFLAVSNTLPASAGYYSITASNVLGTTTRTNLLLTVEPVIVYVPPVSQAIYVGGTVTLTNLALGQPALSYQWQLNGTNIFGATNSSLVISNIQLTNAGDYTVIVSNSLGSATSAPASVTVAPLLITTQPKGNLLFPGGVASFSVTVQSASAVAYQWRLNGDNLPGETGSSLIISNLQAAHSGNYDVIIGNALVTTNSNSATLSLVPLAAWGSNSSGQTNIPATATNIVRIRSNDNSNLAALTSAGRILYWGNTGWITNGTPNDLSDVTDFAMSSYSTIALKSNGSLIAWGYDGAYLTNIPSGLGSVLAVAAGGGHFLALRSNGTVAAWGLNNYGQTDVPLDLTNVISISSFSLHNLALTSEGKVVAWGESGALGRTNVPSWLSNVVAIAAGRYTSAALREDGSVVVWGSNSGNPQILPAAATNLVMITSDMPMAALRDDGQVVVWGDVAPFDPCLPPAGLANVSAITAGAGSYLALIGEPWGRTTPPFTEPMLTQSGFSVSIPTRSGGVYRLEYKNSLSDPNWIALPLVAGTGNMRVITDPSATNSQQRFYRVRQW